MRIGMILANVFPPDIRVEKEARTLLKAGHDVYLLCLKAPGLAANDVYDGIKLYRRDFYFCQKLSVMRKFGKLMDRITFKNYKLMNQMIKFVDENSIDALHIHDLPMVWDAIIIGEKKGIKVIADLHENYPEAVQFQFINTNSKAKFIMKYLDNLDRWKKYEKKCLNQVNHAIVVVDEAKQHIVNDYGIPEDKITVISNTEDVNFFEDIKLNQDLINFYKDHFVITYIGGFGQHRGLDVPIKAMPILKENIPNVKLLLVGDGKDRKDLEQLSADLEVSQYIEFTGWKSFELVPSYIFLSDVCLVPHHSNPHTDSTIPHKIFQYMLMRKPVIVSNCKPLARIVNETEAGLVFESGDSNDFAKACMEMLDNERRKWFGENGRKAVLKKYNWEKTGEELVKIYETIGNT